MNKTTFFLLWVAVNTSSWGVLLFLAGDRHTIGTVPYIGFFMMGGAMGLWQWLLLRRHFPIVWYRWIITSAIGFGVGLIGVMWTAVLDLYIVVNFPYGPLLEWDPLIGGLLLGLALGTCQSLVWRPHSRLIFGWIVANVIGWSLGLFLAAVIVFLLHAVRVDNSVIKPIISGGLFSLATG